MNDSDLHFERPSRPLSGGGSVELVAFTPNPFFTGVASARTCYSSKGALYPEDMVKSEKTKELARKIAASTLKAGHLTTRQHAHFTFVLQGVSRHLIWSFLHAHPFYNSEQVSQRYVEVREDQFYYPPSLASAPNLLELYKHHIRRSMELYRLLTKELMKSAGEEYYRIFPARAANPNKWDAVVKKKAVEAARYILPVSTTAYLYHTVNGLTLHRYMKMIHATDVGEEATSLVHAMIDLVQEKDPLFAEEIRSSALQSSLLTSSEYKVKDNDQDKFVTEFDGELKGLSSRLAQTGGCEMETLASSVRASLAFAKDELSDEDAISLLVHPKKNPHLSSSLNETTFSTLSRSLYHTHFTFQKRISHTADSQDQRHRMVPASRPDLFRHFTGKPDYVTPLLIRQSKTAKQIYDQAMDELFHSIQNFNRAGANCSSAVYLLPNAFPVRFYESGDLLNLVHKWKSRLCYTAQEEIFRTSVEEVEQVLRVYPSLAPLIGAPCHLRVAAGLTPPCPESDRYCGVKVWELPVEQMQRLI